MSYGACGKGYMLLLLGLVLVVPVASTYAQDFSIQHFHADIAINDDGSIDVTETIEVEFERRRHGIYREIPFRYSDELGKRVTMPITIRSVNREDGSDWSYKVSRQGNVINVRIGHPDRYVDDRQVYVIHYEVRNAIRFLDDYDELYWNITGNDWRASIAGASASVRLNTSKSSSSIIGACYTGAYGSAASACRVEERPGGLIFRCDRLLRPGEGFTVAMGFDKGILSPPSETEQLLYAANLRENWVFLIPVIALFYMIVHWYRHGRDPKGREAITVMYEPPEVDGKPLTPAQVGTLVDEQLDQHDITGSLIGLASRGYLEIREEHTKGFIGLFDTVDYRLVQTKAPDDELSDFEWTLMNDLFPGEDKEIATSELKNEFYKKVPNLKKVLFRDLVAKKFFKVAPDKVKRRYALIGVLVIACTAVPMYILVPSNPWKGLIAGLIAGVIVMMFAQAMVAKSKLGALTRAKILGFQEFMNRADRDRLKKLGPETFYKYLAYAIALGVVDHWVDAFDGILTEPPKWFVGPGLHTNFTAHAFSKALTSATSHLGSTMYSAPRGSGSSGGGSSGGGGGGGGGGSW